ncbi:MAG: transcription initiation factor IIB [Nitrososphaera sp.]|nr:transcription initiation factor IIB [Nitrososphaera sp.]
MAGCGICSGQLISDPDTGEEVCGSCGAVARENIEIASERRAFTLEEMDKRYRTGEPASIMMYDMGLSSFIDNKNVDANGKHIQGYTEIERLRRLNKITVSNNSKTKNLNKAMREVRRITEILGIGNPVAERAAYIYRKALDRGLIKGRSITGIVAATVYIACKDSGTPRSIDEIQDVIGYADRKNIAYYYKFLLREMKIRVPLPVPSNSVSRIAGRARLTERTVRKALELLSAVGDNAMLSGKNPVSLAAASLYLATIETGEYTTQLRIAIAADVSTVTVRKRCLEIIKLVKLSNSGLLKALDKNHPMLSGHEGERSIVRAPEDHPVRSARGLFLSENRSTYLTCQCKE